MRYAEIYTAELMVYIFASHPNFMPMLKLNKPSQNAPASALGRFLVTGGVAAFILMLLVSAGLKAGYNFSFVSPAPYLALILSLVVIAVAATLSYIISHRLLPHLQMAAILDHPNERSLHQIPTPRGGGWAIVLVVAAGLAAQAVLKVAELPVIEIGLLIGLSPSVWVSWRDDRQGVGVGLRLLVQALAVLPIATIMLVTKMDDLPASFALCLLGIVVLWVGYLNLYNFMDGIDGLATAQASFLACGGLVLLAVAGTLWASWTLIPILGLIMGASLGFLPLNWRPAKVFLGDVGSICLGFLTGYVVLQLALMGYWAIAMTLPLYFLMDGGLTMLLRLRRGEKIWQPHRTHFYQRAAKAVGRHDVITLKIMGCNLLLCIIAVLSLLLAAPALCLVGPLVVAALLWHFSRIAGEAVAG
jgi:UDP-N-acetylmuramyl pentapeptide phosphotransferase/UDP-N-acetylglucosamine-1-phosphate transferase